MLIVLVSVLTILALGSALPHPWRPAARAALVWFVVSLPITLIVWAIACWPGSSFGSYLVVIPVIVAWCSIVDARHGISSRLARIGPRR